MINIYVYVLDTMADWEIGHVTAELSSGRFFKRDAEAITLKTVSYAQNPVKTMGGLTIIPDCTIDEMVAGDKTVLLLPGGNTWHEPQHGAILDKAQELLAGGATVCAICGATAALAGLGLLDERPHTSNGAGFLDMVSPAYKGQGHYVDEPSVADGNLITAGSTGGLLWAKQIIERLGVMEADALAAWYDYFRTGEAEYFYALMAALPQNGEV